MDFQADFLGLDNVYSYTTQQQPPRRRTSSTSTTSAATMTSTSTSTSTASTTMSSTRTLSPPRKHTSPSTSTQRRTHKRQSANLATDIDAGAVAAFGALRLQSRKPKPAEVISETGSKSSTSAPIDIPPRQTTVRRVARTQHLKDGVWDMRRAMDAAGFAGHMNS